MTSPTRSPAGPEWPRKQYSPVGFRSPPVGFWDPKDHLWAPESPSPARAGPLRAQTRRAQGRPRTAQNHQKAGPDGSEAGTRGVECPRSWMTPTQVPSGLPFGPVSTRSCPQMVSVGPTGTCLGPTCVPRSESENLPYLGLDGPNWDSDLQNIWRGRQCLQM